MSRRYPALFALVVLLVPIVVLSRQAEQAETAQFSTSSLSWMPRIDDDSGLTDTWFCPGVPATGVDGIEGRVRIANRSDEQLAGTVLLMNEAGDNRRIDLEVPAFERTVVELHNALPGEFTGAVVEVEGGDVAIDQLSTHPRGTSRAACSNEAATDWYFADGFTAEESRNQIVLNNPYDQAVVARVEFAVEGGYRTPSAFSSIRVPARGIRVIDLGAPGAGAQGEPLLAVHVSATRGRLVVGRAQLFNGGGRNGHQVSVASPTLASQWWFAGGRNGPQSEERYTIFNPTDRSHEVGVVLLGVSAEVNVDGLVEPIDVEPITVPAFSVVEFDPSTVTGLTEGPYAAVFSTLSEPSIVVERATTLTEGDSTATSVLLGALGRPEDGFVASQWHVVTAPSQPTPDALRLYNVDSTAGTVTVYAVGASGPVAVPSLTDVTLPPASSTLSLDLTDEAVLGRELIIETSNRVFVEQWFPTGVGDVRSASWALPRSEG